MKEIWGFVLYRIFHKKVSCLLTILIILDLLFAISFYLMDLPIYIIILIIIITNIVFIIICIISDYDTEKKILDEEFAKSSKVMQKPKCLHCNKEIQLSFNQKSDIPIYCKNCYPKDRVKAFKKD
jgi:hypothetical protein